MAMLCAIGFASFLGPSLAEFPVPTSLPPHSWETVGHKLFIHGCKAEGPLNELEIALASRFPVLTVEKGQGLQLEGFAEEKMLAVSKQYKAARPDGWSIFYMNSIFDWEFYHMHQTMLSNPDFALRNPVSGEACHKRGDRTFPQPDIGMFVFNLSNPEARKMWVDECRNATESGFDGCFVDGANTWTRCAEDPSYVGCWKHGWSAPCNLSAADFKSLALGQQALLSELQEAVTTDRIIIPKDSAGAKGGASFDDGRYVDSMFPTDAMCSCYNCVWDAKYADDCRIHLNVSMETSARGQIVFQHGEYNKHPDAPSEKEQFRFALATFLISAGDSSFFAFSDGWYYNGTRWHDEYDMTLGAPKGPASLDSTGIWRREFQAGVVVALDVDGNSASIDWGPGSNDNVGSSAPDPCPYFGKKCSETPKGTCGWDDPDPGVRAACQHESAVCGSSIPDPNEHICQLGPPLARSGTLAQALATNTLASAGNHASCTATGKGCKEAKECCDVGGKPAVCIEQYGNLPTCVKAPDPRDCKYYGMRCSETPKGTCGWDDPDHNTQEACEHQGAVCGEDKFGNHVCVQGPPGSPFVV